MKKKILIRTVIIVIFVAISIAGIYYLKSVKENKITYYASYEETESLLSGLYYYRDGIILKSDDVEGFPIEAFVYEEDILKQLKTFETKILLDDCITTDGDVHEILVKYYVCNSTIYAYTEDKDVNLEPIPNDSKQVLVWGEKISSPLLYHIEKGTYKVLEEQYIAQFDGSVSPNGTAVAFIGKNNDSNEKFDISIWSLETNKIINIPTLIDDDQGHLYHIYQYTWSQDGSILYIEYTDEYWNSDKAFGYDVKTKERINYAIALTSPEVSGGKKDKDYSYLFTQSVPKDGMFMVTKIGSDGLRIFEMEPNTLIYGLPSPSGTCFIGGYRTVASTEEYDGLGQLVDKEENLEEYIPIFMNKEEIFYLSEYIPEYTLTTYKGYELLNQQWISETSILLCYGNNEQCYTEILRLENYLPLK